MFSQLSKKRFSLSIGVSLLAVTLSGAAAAQEANSDDDLFVFEEITVTALKREGQSLQDAPAAISVLTGDDIDVLNADRLTDFLQLSPGVALDISGQSGAATTIGIRGINSTFGSASVGFYIDELPFSFTNVNLVPDPSPFDLDRIEVLKGPQGTLYGAGSSGGVVRVLTRDPNLEEFEGLGDFYGSTTDGGGENYTLSGAVNVPIIQDKLALRAAVTYSDNSGWIDDSFTIPNVVSFFGENVNDEENVAWRAKLLFQATESLSIKLFGNFQRRDAGAPQLADDSGQFPFVGDRSEVASDFDQYGAVITYDLPGATITNITGYLEFDNPVVRDGILVLPSNAFLESFSNELRINSTGSSNLSWVGGFFYRDTDQENGQQTGDLGFLGNAAGIIIPQDVLDTANSEQVSVFGEATLALFDDKLELTVGGSYFWDDSTQSSFFIPNESAPILAGRLGVPVETLIPPNFDSSVVETRLFNPKVSAAYFPTDDITIYAVYSEGFRTGFNDFGISTFSLRNLIGSSGGDTSAITGAVQAETIDAYEIGLKGSFFSNLLYLELAVYQNNISDSQQNAGVFDPVSGLSVNTAQNVGDARTRGIEWLVRLNEPIPGLNLFVSGTVLEAEVREDFEAGGILAFEEGQRLNATPEFILNTGGSYKWDLGIGDLSASLSANLQYSSDRSLSQLGAEPLIGDNITQLDARFSVGKDTWDVYVFAQNLLDESGRVNPSILGESPLLPALGVPIDGELGTRIRPLSIGAGIRFRY